jgi:hypothetical protein
MSRTHRVDSKGSGVTGLQEGTAGDGSQGRERDGGGQQGRTKNSRAWHGDGLLAEEQGTSQEASAEFWPPLPSLEARSEMTAAILVAVGEASVYSLARLRPSLHMSTHVTRYLMLPMSGREIVSQILHACMPLTLPMSAPEHSQGSDFLWTFYGRTLSISFRSPKHHPTAAKRAEEVWCSRVY